MSGPCHGLQVQNQRGRDIEHENLRELRGDIDNLGKGDVEGLDMHAQSDM